MTRSRVSYALVAFLLVALPFALTVFLDSSKAASRQTPNERFVAAVHAKIPEMRAKPVPLAGYGHEVCADLDAGWTEQQLDESGFQAGLSAPARHALVELSAQYLCPQNRGKL